MSRDRKAASLNHDQRLKLISFIHLNECLWKNGKDGGSKASRSTDLWQKFINDNKLSCSIHQLKQHWQNLRNNFSKKYKANELSNIPTAHEQENWPFYKHLMFIKGQSDSVMDLDDEEFDQFSVECELFNNDDLSIVNNNYQQKEVIKNDRRSKNSDSKSNNLSFSNMNESRNEDETGNEAFAQYVLKQLNSLKDDPKSLRRLRHNIENTIFNFFEENT